MVTFFLGGPYQMESLLCSKDEAALLSVIAFLLRWPFLFTLHRVNCAIPGGGAGCENRIIEKRDIEENDGVRR